LKLPTKRQNLLFSATFSKDQEIGHGHFAQPVHVEATRKTRPWMLLSKKYILLKEKKTELIIKLITEGNWKQILVFTRTKQGANKLTESMISAGIKAAIHGNKGQGARTKALAGFKDGSLTALVATDIAPRSGHPLLPHVVNFELPNIPEDYVHRIGRTGRAEQAEKLFRYSVRRNGFFT
jgi:ATP-dependent RNA helicase RhlE